MPWRGIILNHEILGVLGQVRPDGLWFYLVNMSCKVFVQRVPELSFLCRWVSYNV